MLINLCTYIYIYISVCVCEVYKVTNHYKLYPNTNFMLTLWVVLDIHSVTACLSVKCCIQDQVQVTGEFPSQRPVMGSFDVLFDLCLNKQLSKQSRGWWFETPSCSLWHQGNGWFCTLFHIMCIVFIHRGNRWAPIQYKDGTCTSGSR